MDPIHRHRPMQRALLARREDLPVRRRGRRPILSGPPVETPADQAQPAPEPITPEPIIATDQIDANAITPGSILDVEVTVAAGTIGDLLAAATALITSGNAPTTPLVAVVRDGRIESLQPAEGTDGP